MSGTVDIVATSGGNPVDATLKCNGCHAVPSSNLHSDGVIQVTYNGHPLYYFTADTAGGTAHGQAVTAFGAEWYVVGASGSKIDTS